VPKVWVNLSANMLPISNVVIKSQNIEIQV
jgi:hypothetical protein